MKLLGYFESKSERIEIRTFEDIMFVKYRLRRIKDEIQRQGNVSHQ